MHPLLAAALLLGMASVAGAAEPAVAPAKPTIGTAREDWSDVGDIPVRAALPATGAAIAPAPVVPPEEAQLVPRFERALAATRSASTPSQRVIAYGQALELFDRIRVRQPEFRFKPGTDALASAYVDALNASRAALQGEAHERNLGEARAVVLRLESADARTSKLLDIATVERASGTPQQLLIALHGVVNEVQGMNGAARDRALLRAVEIAAGAGPEPLAASQLWFADIDDHDLRNQALRRIAQASIDADPLLKELSSNPSLGSDSRARLLDLSNYMTNEGRFDAATWSAAAAEGDPRGERDEALAMIVEDMLEADAPPFTILAVHGITGASLRDRVLLQMIEHSLETSHLHEARRAASLITAARATTLAWSRIGLWLVDQDYLQQGRDAAKLAMAGYRASPGAAGPGRDAVLARLLELQVRLDQRQEARSLISQVGDDATSAAIRLSLVRRALDAGAWAEAEADLDEVPAGGIRDLALAAYADALADDGRHPEALALVARISRPLPRMDALTAIVKALASSAIDPTLQQTLAKQVQSLAAQLPLGAGRDTGHAFVAQAAAAVGDFEGARRSLQLCAGSEEFGDALRYAAQRMTLAGQADAVLRDLDKVWQPTERLRAQIAVASVMAKQGQLDRAVGIVRPIDDERLRVEAFGNLARASAQRTDDQDLLRRKSGKGASPIPVSLRATNEPEEVASPFFVSRARSLYRLANEELGDRLPAIPPLQDLSARTVAGTIPTTAPGRLYVLPLQYSDFNEKFLSSLSYAFNEFGGSLFYFDAQKTAFPVFISLDSGVFDLPSIAHYLERIGKPQYLVREGRRYTLRIPLVVGPNATLVVSGSDVEELRMSRGSGAYLVNAGKLSVQSTVVSGWDEALDAYAALDYKTAGTFRPFIVSWSGSVTDIAGSKLTHLGFSGSKAYGLTYSSGPEIVLKSQPTNLNRPTGRIVDNTIQNLLFGFYSYEADDVAMVGNEYRDNIVYGIDPHDRSRRLVIAYNSVYGTAVKHGIIVSREVHDSWIAGNLSFDNKGTGIMLDRNSTGNLLYANSAFANQQDGVALFESPCNIIASNQLFSNHRDALKSRNSWDVGVFGNWMSGNRGMAVNSYVATLPAMHDGRERDFEEDPYTPFSDIALVRNTLMRNGAGGIGLEGVSSVTWKGNSLVGQVKPVKGVDKAVLPELYGRSNNGVVVRLGCEVPKIAQACGFRRLGLLPRQNVYEPLPGCAVAGAPSTAPVAKGRVSAPGGVSRALIGASGK